MKQLLITIAAVVLVGCATTQQSNPEPESDPIEPITEAANPEPPKAKAPDISIHLAADKGNLEAVKQHLAAGTDVNALSLGFKPLHLAAMRGRMEIAELLIAEGADVNGMNGIGETPLDWAIHSKLTEIADLLRKHGGKTAEELKAEGK